jgi:hypothetical protein
MISRLARRRRSRTCQVLLWLPHTRLVSHGRLAAGRKPMLLLIPGNIL